MRGYLGNSARARMKDGGGPHQGRRQRQAQPAQSRRRRWRRWRSWRRRRADARGVSRRRGVRRDSGCGARVDEERDEPLRAEDAARGGARGARRVDGAREPRPVPQAGHHLFDPQGAREERREHLRRRRPRDPAGRLRLPALVGRLVSRGPRRHLREPEPDPAFQPAHRRHRVGAHPAAEGRRALLRAAQSRRDQPRRAGEREEQGAVREPDAAVPEEAAEARAGQRQHRGPDGAHHRHGRADRQRASAA